MIFITNGRNMKIIKISGFEVIIDDEDFERIKKLGWYVQKNQDYKDGRFYFNAEVFINDKRTVTKLHRFIMGCQVGDKKQIDHINGNTLDNRKENLRFCTNSENMANKKLISKNNKSGYKGVSVAGKKWKATVYVNSKAYNLGYFVDPKEAAKEYDNMVRFTHGRFARVNFPDEKYDEEKAIKIAKGWGLCR